MNSNSKKRKSKNLSAKKVNNNSTILENSKCKEVEKSAFDLSDLLKKRWKVYRVSPLYNFSTDKFKFYEKLLISELDGKKKLSSVTYKCKFEYNNKMKLCEKFVEALQVEVITNSSKTSYIGYFVSFIDSSVNLEGCVSLPVLLVKSKRPEAYIVNSILSKIFDCDIQPVTFSFFALITFFFKLLENPVKSEDFSQEILSLQYKIPECKNADSITVTFMLEDTTIILAVVIDSLREKIPGIHYTEIVIEFYNRVLNHIYNTYKMELMRAELHKIIFPHALITVDGELKVSTEESAEIVFEILKHFTPLSAITNFSQIS